MLPLCCHGEATTNPSWVWVAANCGDVLVTPCYLVAARSASLPAAAVEEAISIGYLDRQC